MEKRFFNTTGWMKIACVDMLDTCQRCPSGFLLRTDGGVRSCGKSGSGCASTTFSTRGIKYSRVCGRVRAYQYGNAFAFHYGYHSHFSIRLTYVDGVSITYGSRPRKHIWTFAAARTEYFSNSYAYACPCTRTDQNYTGAVPPFVGEDYFCDTALASHETFATQELYTNDPLWDGQGCGPTST